MKQFLFRFNEMCTITYKDLQPIRKSFFRYLLCLIRSIVLAWKSIVIRLFLSKKEAILEYLPIFKDSLRLELVTLDQFEF